MMDLDALTTQLAALPNTLTDIDSRLEQLANQQQQTNSLLALLIIHRELSVGEPAVRLDSTVRGLLEVIAAQTFGERKRQPFAPTTDDLAHLPVCTAWAAVGEESAPIETLAGAYIHDADVACTCACHLRTVQDDDHYAGRNGA